MSNLLAGLLFPIIIGMSLLVSLYTKKKKVSKKSPSIEFKMTVSRDHPIVSKGSSSSSSYSKKRFLQIRVPKLVE